MFQLADIQRHVGVRPDGVWGPNTATAIAQALGIAAAAPAPSTVEPFAITARGAAEIVGHEAIVQEAYKDSVGVWTWGIGVTSASGHDVDRYRDNPQPIARCLEIYVWLLREKYAPAVREAFAGIALTEAQFHAALSFHYNTGAIGRAGWVKLFRAGQVEQARAAFMEWRKPPEIVTRRQAECDLFFDGEWSGDGRATVYPVRKPSYAPGWGGATRVDVLTPLGELLS